MKTHIVKEIPIVAWTEQTIEVPVDSILLGVVCVNRVVSLSVLTSTTETNTKHIRINIVTANEPIRHTGSVECLGSAESCGAVWYVFELL